MPGRICMRRGVEVLDVGEEFGMKSRIFAWTFSDIQFERGIDNL